MSGIDNWLLYIILGLLALIVLLLIYIALKIRKKFRREPDWTLVYPELAGMYCADDTCFSRENPDEKLRSITEDLDSMLMEAKVERENRDDAKEPEKPAREYYKEELNKDPEVNSIMGDELLCSAYAPEAVSRDEEFIVAAFAHLPEQKEEVEEMARMIDDEIVKRAEKFLSLKVEQGNKIGFF